MRRHIVQQHILFSKAEFRHDPEPLMETRKLWAIRDNKIKLYYHHISLGLDGELITCPSCFYHTFRLDDGVLDMQRHIIDKHIELVIFCVDKRAGCKASYYSPFSRAYDE
jgi:hypothetical protein